MHKDYKSGARAQAHQGPIAEGSGLKGQSSRTDDQGQDPEIEDHGPKLRDQSSDAKAQGQKLKDQSPGANAP